MSKLASTIAAGFLTAIGIGLGLSHIHNKRMNENRQWEYDKEHCVEWSREETLPRKCNCYDNEKCAKEAKR